MWFSVLKELQDKWIVSAYDYLRANPQIGINGFKEAGAIEDPDDFADVAEENWLHQTLYYCTTEFSHRYNAQYLPANSNNKIQNRLQKH